MRLYNHHIPQRALGHIAPVQALQDWQETVSYTHLDVYKRQVSNLQALIPQPEADEQPTKTFKDDEPGFVHVLSLIHI